MSQEIPSEIGERYIAFLVSDLFNVLPIANSQDLAGDVIGFVFWRRFKATHKSLSFNPSIGRRNAFKACD